jgi:transposase
LLWQGILSLDFSGFDRKYINDREGRPAIDPRRLAAVWILALLRGVTSSVAVARLCDCDIEFRWLTGDCGVEKSSLSAFRSGHLEELSDLSTQVLASLSRSGLLPAADLAVDGTVIRAAASCDRITNRDKLVRRLGHLRAEIQERLERGEDDEDDPDSGVTVLRQRQQRLEVALAEIEKLGLAPDKRVAWTEPEASVKRLKNGSYAPAHNIQAVTDLSSGAIIHLEVVARNNDKRLLLPDLQGAQEGLRSLGEKLPEGKSPVAAVKSLTADAGYHDTLQLMALENYLDTYVPDDEHRHRRPTGVSAEYLGERFVYDREQDEMICPQGKRLRRRKLNTGRTAMAYQAGKSDCDSCVAKSECCPKSKEGRSVNRPLYGELLQKVAERVASPLGQWLKRARKVTMEGAFARLTELLNWRRCRCWGRLGATAEGLWRMVGHNLLLSLGHWQPLILEEARPG